MIKISKKNPVAYFCAEFALVDEMPSYAGGLGILAGDYILEAARQDFPLVGLGLYYQKGQNQQIIQDRTPGEKFGLKLLQTGGWLMKKRVLISIPVGDKDIWAQVWQYKNRNNSVYFLDTNIDENEPKDRLITEQLYTEDRELRLRQELVLGIGGVRLLNKLDLSPSVYHLNEGHSAFLILELLGQEVKNGLNFSEAWIKVREKVVFTNHTLVLEGQEMFAFDSLIKNTRKLCVDLKLNINDIIEKGKSRAEDTLFSMTNLALNGSRITNAVSRIHGDKARELWPQHNIIHITNGIFVPRWDRVCGKDLDKEHKKNEEVLLKLIRKTHGDKWQKESLLIGWSRRFVPYKRPLALLEDVAKLKKIIEIFNGQVHIVYSAPLDEDEAEKNQFLKKIEELMRGELKGFVTFIPHYKINMAKVMVAGCDLWLNTPIVGREACGTSGMKAALNGTLAVSTDDGWINETTVNDFGWLIDDINITTDLLEKLQTKIIPEYKDYLKNPQDSAWKRRMTKAREIILKDFSTERMLGDYIDKSYLAEPKKNQTGGSLLSKKKLIAFDVDNTLSKSRSPIDTEMADLLKKLLGKKKVAIITGGAFADIKKQVLDPIGQDKKCSQNLILLPTNGGGMWTCDEVWKEIANHNLLPAEKEKIIKALQEVDQADPELCNNKSYGREIQDRESEITYAAWGENAPLDLKRAWDPDMKKRITLQAKLQEKLPEFEVKIGGTTSIDITPKGMDKAYAIKKILEYFNYTKEDVLFFGDAVYENGNDYPVFEMGVETIKVISPEETKERLLRLIAE